MRRKAGCLGMNEGSGDIPGYDETGESPSSVFSTSRQSALYTVTSLSKTFS